MNERTARPVAITILQSCYVKYGSKRHVITHVSYDPQRDTYTCYDHQDDILAMLTDNEVDELIQRRGLPLSDNVAIKFNHP